jgi:hypothetical protein
MALLLAELRRSRATATPRASPIAVPFGVDESELHLLHEVVEQVVVERRRRHDVRAGAEDHGADAVGLSARDEIAQHGFGHVEARGPHAAARLGHVLPQIFGHVVEHGAHRAGQVERHDQVDAFLVGVDGAQRVQRARQSGDAEREPEVRASPGTSRRNTRAPAGPTTSGPSVPSRRRGVRRSSPKMARWNTTARAAGRRAPSFPTSARA